MNVYRVYTTRKNPRGEPIFINFGCSIPTLQAFVDELNKGKAVYGWNLATKWDRDENGSFLVITHKMPYGIAPGGVASVENPPCRFVEYAE